ncbi:MAG: bifunctional DedA family/phosphatase PAP2 family protein [Solirubrobacterales bacterium]
MTGDPTNGLAPLAITLPHATAAIAAAVWAASVVVRRKRMSTERWIISGIGIVLLTVFAAGLFSHLPEPAKVLEDIADALGAWTYLLVGLLAFLETGAFVGLIAPGEAAVIVGGVVAGQGDIDIRLLIGLVWFAALAGDSASFVIGRRLGRGFLERHGPRFQITEPRLQQVEKYMSLHGGKTILIGRFIGLVRALAPFIAGASRMPYRRFLPYDVIGSGLWAVAFCMLGYVFSQNLKAVLDYAERGVLIFGWTVGTIVVIFLLIRRFRKPEERAKLVQRLDEIESRHPGRARFVRPLRRGWERAVMPFARWSAPKLRFAWARVTPGGLGIEFTTAASIVVVSGYTFYFFLIAALDWPTNEFARRINDGAFRISDSLRTDWLNDLAEVITQLGALSVVAPLVGAAAAYCVYRRRFPEAVTLVLSLILTVAIVQATKPWTEVPRPSNPLSGFDSWSFPSGHAAYAVSYVTIAIAIARVGGFFTRAALTTAAAVLGTAIAASRVYLRVHYLSDLIGGVAIGFLTTALIACVALVVVHLRNGQREPGRTVDKVDNQ